MAFWLFIIIAAYFFFSLAFLGDKLVLSGPPKPKLYTFYVGALNIFMVILLPFVKFDSYHGISLVWAALTAAVSILGLYTMFTALEKFEASRVMPTIGGLQPIFVLVLTWFFWGFQTVSRMNFLAFALLLVGSIVISIEKKLTITIQYLLITVFSSLMFSLAYIFSKMVFLNQSFFSGLTLIGLCTCLFVLLFLFDKDLRSQVFSKKAAFDKKTSGIFLFAQSAGGIANLLQSLAISLVPVSYLAIVNSLRGIQYVFLFLITLFFSTFYPRILKEDISKKIIIQKTAAIFIIVLGLLMLL